MSRTAHPTASVEAFVSSAPCGHRHGVRSYADGCSYATQMTWAIDAANEGDHDRARLYVLAADRALMPLCNINNPESLRDEQACEADAVLRGNFAFDRISIASFDGSKTHEVDEVRVGTHFLAVTGRWGNNGRIQRPIATRVDAAGCRLAVRGWRPEAMHFAWPLAASR